MDYAQDVKKALSESGFRVLLKDQDDKIGAKIRQATLEKIPYLLVVGDKEKEAKKVAVRTRSGKDLGVVELESFSKMLQGDIEGKKPQS